MQASVAVLALSSRPLRTVDMRFWNGNGPDRLDLRVLCMALLLGGRLRKLRPDVLPVVGAQVSPRDLPLRSQLDSYRRFLWHNALP